MHLTTQRLLELRADARLERTTMMETRGRHGEDPAVSMEQMSSIDGIVVLNLRDELLEQDGKLAEFNITRLMGRVPGPDGEKYAHMADQVEFEILREIALDCPPLTQAVWELAGRLRVVGAQTEPEAGAEAQR
ncbi:MULTISPECIES: hypothetical protein [unclassified Leucobacter]|uniref:hypothetical protein n=1 Tax=unclassified Leucobacter TaxID=2621730 RepID=UPI00165E05C4|nr:MULTISPECIES: hypothetical protein [unclassified Leucobacter]MBC9927550.1 hypothetical protein [Leucobacter sp. cx-169]